MHIKFILVLVGFIFCISTARSSVLTDSIIKYKPLYTKKELKKEAKDIKEFGKLVKDFSKTSKSDNIDYLNSKLEKLKVRMNEEHQELNARISARTRRIKPAKINRDSLSETELPKGYNTNIGGQIVNANKSEIMEKRSETEILLKYSKVLSKENAIVRKLKNVTELTKDTPSRTIEEIISDSNDFVASMKEELALMTKEKGKK